MIDGRQQARHFRRRAAVVVSPRLIPDFPVGNRHALALAKHLDHRLDQVKLDHDSGTVDVVEQFPHIAAIALADFTEPVHDVNECICIFRPDLIFDGNHDGPFMHFDVPWNRAGPVMR